MAIRNKTTAVLLVVFVAALGAGVVAGTLASRLPSVQTSVDISGGEHSPLVDELQLNASQRDQMRDIWEDVRKVSNQCQVDGELAQKQRDDDVFKMLTPEQKSRYAVMNQDLAGKLKALSDQRESAFNKGVKRTDAILSPQQRQAYEQMINTQVGQITAGGGIGQPPPANWGLSSGSTTQQSP